MPSSTAFIRYAGQLKSAPDGKVYLACAWTDAASNENYPYPDSAYYMDNMYLGVVSNPNVYGVGCNFNPYGFYLGGKRVYWGLPNNPDYELGADVGSPCDTLTAVSNLQWAVGRGEVTAFYHSGWQKLFVNAQNIKGKNCLLQIVDMLGNKVYSNQTQTQPPYFTQDVNVFNLSNGMYVVNLITEKEKMSCKFVKQ